MCHGISFGKPPERRLDPGKSFFFDEGSVYTFLDTGASYIQVPRIYWDHFVDNLVASSSGKEKFTDWYVKKGYLFVNCQDALDLLPSIYLLLGDHWFEIQ